MPKMSQSRSPKRRELPSTLRRSPKKARDTFAETHDAAVEQYGEGRRADQTAYAALKHSFEKVGNHWEPKKRRGPSDAQSAKGGAHSPAAVPVRGRCRCERLEEPSPRRRCAACTSRAVRRWTNASWWARSRRRTGGRRRAPGPVARAGPESRSRSPNRAGLPCGPGLPRRRAAGGGGAGGWAAEGLAAGRRSGGVSTLNLRRRRGRGDE